MKRNIFFIKGEEVVYNGESYNIDTLREEIKLPKQMVIYILEEDLFINNYVFSSRIHYKDEIDKSIRNTFGVDKDYLFDYRVEFKNKKVTVYTVKGGNRVAKICMDSSDLKVIPLQFEILRKAKGKITDKNYQLLYLYDESYYFLKVYNKKLQKSVVKNSLDDVKNMLDISGDISIYIDNNIENLDIKNKKQIQLGGILDEKVSL